MESPPIAQLDHVADVSKSPPSLRSDLLRALAQGLAYWAAGSIPVFLAVLWVYSTEPPGLSLLDRFARWDGEQYLTICTSGYSYHPEQPTEVAFLPAYPLLARPLVLMGLSPQAALLLVSHSCLAACFIVLAAYLRCRYSAQPAVAHFVLAVLAFAPIAFFFRMAYSESLFFFLTILCFYAMQRGTEPFARCRPGRFGHGRPADRSGSVSARAALRLASVADREKLLFPSRGTGPVPGFGGSSAHTLYLEIAFHAPFAYSEGHRHWLVPGRSLDDKWLSLLTLEPFWGPFNPASPCYWNTRAPGMNPWLNFFLVNPVTFAAAVILTTVGAWRGWLNRSEAWLAAGLLLIAYLGRSYEMCMLGGARFVSVVFPIYMVAGRILWLLPRPLAYALLALAAAALAYASACFALGLWCFF